MMTPFESAVRGSLEGSHGDRVLVRDDHGATALHHYAGLNWIWLSFMFPPVCGNGVYPCSGPGLTSEVTKGSPVLTWPSCRRISQRGFAPAPRLWSLFLLAPKAWSTSRSSWSCAFTRDGDMLRGW